MLISAVGSISNFATTLDKVDPIETKLYLDLHQRAFAAAKDILSEYDTFRDRDLMQLSNREKNHFNGLSRIISGPDGHRIVALRGDWFWSWMKYHHLGASPLAVMPTCSSQVKVLPSACVLEIRCNFSTHMCSVYTSITPSERQRLPKKAGGILFHISDQGTVTEEVSLQ